MGPPKTWKTGAVVSSYPKPMFVFQGDEGGLDIIKTPIHWVTTIEAVEAQLKKPITEQPPIVAFQFNKNPDLMLNESFNPLARDNEFISFNKVGNILFKTKPFPFKTVVLDPLTQVSSIILSAFAKSNAAKMQDARKWASGVGDKTKNTVAAFFTLPCHVVCIMHTALNKVVNEKGEVTSQTEEPVLYSKLRDIIGSLPSQFFFHNSITVSGKTQSYILTAPDARVKGIGVRWPTGLPVKLEDPTFDKIYGAAVTSGETTA